MTRVQILVKQKFGKIGPQPCCRRGKKEVRLQQCWKRTATLSALNLNGTMLIQWMLRLTLDSQWTWISIVLLERGLTELWKLGKMQGPVWSIDDLRLTDSSRRFFEARFFFGFGSNRKKVNRTDAKKMHLFVFFSFGLIFGSASKDVKCEDEDHR